MTARAVRPQGPSKDIVVETPPGSTGDPTVVEQCPQYEVTARNCPPSTQIGFAKLSIAERYGLRRGRTRTSPTLPVYNVVPDKGYPAEFVILIPWHQIPIPLYVSVTPESDYGVRVTTPDIAEVRQSAGSVGDVLRDAPRPTKALRRISQSGHGRGAAGVPGQPGGLLDGAADCHGEPDSWQNPAPWLPDGQPI